MGSLAQQFTNAVVVCEHIEQGVKSGRISAPIENRGFEWKEVNHIEDGYKGRKNLSQNYHTSSQIADIKKPEPQNFQAKSQIRNYQRVQEQLPPLPLPLNEMYQKLLSIRHIALEPLAPLQPLTLAGISQSSLANTMLVLPDMTFIFATPLRENFCN